MQAENYYMPTAMMRFILCGFGFAMFMNAASMTCYSGPYTLSETGPVNSCLWGQFVYNFVQTDPALNPNGVTTTGVTASDLISNPGLLLTSLDGTTRVEVWASFQTTSTITNTTNADEYFYLEYQNQGGPLKGIGMSAFGRLTLPNLNYAEIACQSGGIVLSNSGLGCQNSALQLSNSSDAAFANHSQLNLNSTSLFGSGVTSAYVAYAFQIHPNGSLSTFTTESFIPEPASGALVLAAVVLGAWGRKLLKRV
jgi:hypothetical protein